MQSITFEPILFPLESPQLYAAIAAIPQVELSTILPDFSNTPLVDHEFVARQHSAKRIVAHVAGRYCLALLLENIGFSDIGFAVSKEKSGKPRLEPSLISFSIAHDSLLAITVMSDCEQLVGVDIEISNRIIPANVLNQITTGKQLDYLHSCSKYGPERLDGWLLREAICKAASEPLSSHAKKIIVGDELTNEEASLDGQTYSVQLLTKRLDDSEHRICIAHHPGVKV
jgi:phosphopantetheinyl transferase